MRISRASALVFFVIAWLTPSVLAQEIKGTAPATAAPVVSTEWVASQLEDPVLGIIDARGLRAFLTGHIPGAQVIEPDNVRSTAGGVPASLHEWPHLASIVNRSGLSPGRHVVVYGDESDVNATYIAMVMRLAGLPRVSVLDGGFKKWTGEKRPFTTARNMVPKASATLTPDAEAIAGLEEMKKIVAGKKAIFLDVRPAEQFQAGRIPGAKNRFWKTDIAADGTFRPEADIKAELVAMGMTPDKPVIVYCNSGHQASEGFYTLRYRLGYPNVRLYQGSWLEWSMAPSTPKETGPAEIPK